MRVGKDVIVVPPKPPKPIPTEKREALRKAAIERRRKQLSIGFQRQRVRKPLPLPLNFERLVSQGAEPLYKAWEEQRQKLESAAKERSRVYGEASSVIDEFGDAKDRMLLPIRPKPVDYDKIDREAWKKAFGEQREEDVQRYLELAEEENRIKKTYDELTKTMFPELSPKERERVSNAWYLREAVQQGVPAQIALDDMFRIGTFRNMYNQYIRSVNRLLTVPKNLSHYLVSNLKHAGVLSPTQAQEWSDLIDLFTEGTMLGQSYQDALARHYKVRPPKNAWESALFIGNGVAVTIMEILAISKLGSIAKGAIGAIFSRLLAARGGRVGLAVLDALSIPTKSSIVPKYVSRVLGSVKFGRARDFLHVATVSAILNAQDIDPDQIVREYVDAGFTQDEAERLATADLAAAGLWRISLDMFPIGEYLGHGLTREWPMVYRMMALGAMEGATEFGQDAGAPFLQRRIQESRFGAAFTQAPTAKELFESFTAGAIAGSLLGGATSQAANRAIDLRGVSQTAGKALGLPKAAASNVLGRFRGQSAQPSAQPQKEKKVRTGKVEINIPQGKDKLDTALAILSQDRGDRASRDAIRKAGRKLKNDVLDFATALADRHPDAYQEFRSALQEYAESTVGDEDARSGDVVAKALDWVAQSLYLFNDASGSKISGHLDGAKIESLLKSRLSTLSLEERENLATNLLLLRPLQQFGRQGFGGDRIAQILSPPFGAKEHKATGAIGVTDLLIDHGSWDRDEALETIAEIIDRYRRGKALPKSMVENYKKLLLTPEGRSAYSFILGYIQAGGYIGYRPMPEPKDGASVMERIVNAITMDANEAESRRINEGLAKQASLAYSKVLPNQARTAYAMGANAALVQIALRAGGVAKNRVSLQSEIDFGLTDDSNIQSFYIAMNELAQAMLLLPKQPTEAPLDIIASTLDVEPSELKRMIAKIGELSPDGFEAWYVAMYQDAANQFPKKWVEIHRRYEQLHKAARRLEHSVRLFVAQGAPTKEIRHEKGPEGQPTADGQDAEQPGVEEAQRHAVRGEPGAEEAGQAEQSYEVLLRRGGDADRVVLKTPKGDIHLGSVVVESGSDYSNLVRGVQSRAKRIELDWTDERIGSANEIHIGAKGAKLEDLVQPGVAVLLPDKAGAYTLYAPVIEGEAPESLRGGLVRDLGAVVVGDSLLLRFDPVTGALLNADGKPILFEERPSESEAAPAAATLSALLAHAPETSLPYVVARSHAIAASSRTQLGATRLVLPKNPDAPSLKKRWLDNFRLRARAYQSNEALAEKLEEAIQDDVSEAIKKDLDHPYFEHDGKGVYANRRVAIISERAVKEDGSPSMADDNAKHASALLSMYEKARFLLTKRFKPAAFRRWLAHLRASVALDKDSIATIYHDEKTGQIGLATFGAKVEYVAETSVEAGMDRVASLYAKDLLKAMEAMAAHGGPYTIELGDHDIIRFTALEMKAYAAAMQAGYTFAKAPSPPPSPKSSKGEITPADIDPYQGKPAAILTQPPQNPPPAPSSFAVRKATMTREELEIYERARERYEEKRSTRSKRGYFLPLHEDPLFASMIRSALVRAEREKPTFKGLLTWTRLNVWLNDNGKIDLNLAKDGTEWYGKKGIPLQGATLSNHWDKIATHVRSVSGPLYTGYLKKGMVYFQPTREAVHNNNRVMVYKAYTVPRDGYYVMGKWHRNRRHYIKSLRKMARAGMYFEMPRGHLFGTSRFRLKNPFSSKEIAWAPLNRRELIKLLERFVQWVQTGSDVNVGGVLGYILPGTRAGLPNEYSIDALISLDEQNFMRTAFHEFGHWITLIDPAEWGKDPVLFPTVVHQLLGDTLESETHGGLFYDEKFVEQVARLTVAMRGAPSDFTEEAFIDTIKKVYKDFSQYITNLESDYEQYRQRLAAQSADALIRERLRKAGKRPLRRLPAGPPPGPPRPELGNAPVFGPLTLSFKVWLKVNHNFSDHAEYRMNPNEILADVVAAWFINQEYVAKNMPDVHARLSSIFTDNNDLVAGLEAFANEISGIKRMSGADDFILRSDFGYEQSKQLYDLREQQRQLVNENVLGRVGIALMDSAYSYLLAGKKKLISKEKAQRVAWAIEEMMAWFSPLNLWYHRLSNQVFRILSDHPYNGPWIDKYLHRRLHLDALIAQTNIVEGKDKFLSPYTFADINDINASFLPEIATELRNRHGLDEQTALEVAGEIVDRINVAADRFRSLLNEAVMQGVKAGLYGKKLRAVIEQNADVYAKLAEIDHYFEQIGWKIYKRTGRSEVPGDVVFASLVTGTEIILHSRRNKAALRALLALRDSPLIPTRVVQQRPINAPKGTLITSPDVRNNPHWMFQHEDYIEAYHKGRRIFMIVPREYAAAFKVSDPSVFRQLTTIMSTTFFQTLHQLYVTYSVGFAANNPFRDVTRTALTLGLRIPKDKLFEYHKEAYERAKRFLIEGKDDPVIAEMLENAALMPPLGHAQGILLRDETPDVLAERLAATYGLSLYETGRKKKGPEVSSRSLQQISKFVDGMAKAANAIPMATSMAEYTHKTAIYLALRRLYPNMDAEERAAIVRNKVGTPNYMRKGTHAWIIKPLAPYLNVAMQAWRETLPAILTNKRAFMNWFLISFLPRAILRVGRSTGYGYLAFKSAAEFYAYLLAGDDEEERRRIALRNIEIIKSMQAMLNAIPDYYMKAYVVIPVGVWTDKKSTLFLTFRDDEIGAALANMALDLMSMDKGVWDRFSSMFADMQPAIPGINPFIDIAYKTALYFSGRNPPSRLWGTNIIPEQDFIAGFRYSIDDFLSYVFYQGGALKQYVWDPAQTIWSVARGDGQLNGFEIVNGLTLGLTGAFLRVGPSPAEATSSMLRRESRVQGARLRLSMPKPAQALHDQWTKLDDSISALNPEEITLLPKRLVAQHAVLYSFERHFYRPVLDVLKNKDVLVEMGYLDNNTIREIKKFLGAAANVHRDMLSRIRRGSGEDAIRLAREEIERIDPGMAIRAKVQALAKRSRAISRQRSQARSRAVEAARAAVAQ